MTQVIDGKVVEMKFDNTDFEKNVAQSMSTLDKLKQALNFDTAKSLQDIGKASKGFQLDGVNTAVESVQAKFSAMQVVGITALSELTKAAMHMGATVVNKVISPIKQGGLNRALNLEQAKFQLEGLGIAWEKVYDDINYAVKGTAYGLDSAAKAAAQLSASNVEAGDSMKRALRGISGVAAMTNQSYDDIAQIFTTVAGNGRVMAGELNRIGKRGLNASAALATYFNNVNSGSQEASEDIKAMVKEISGGLSVTEDDIKDFASKGKINFEIFAAAMDSAFGQHAKDANKTFTGALSNVKAALSRLGAKVYTPGLEDLRKIFVELIKLIDSFSESMDKPIEFINNGLEKISNQIVKILSNKKAFDEIFKNISEGLGQGLYDILLVLKPIHDAFRDLFPKASIENVIVATRNIADFLAQLRISQETANNLYRTFRGVFAIFDILKQAFVAVVEAIFPATKGVGTFADKLLSVTAIIGDYIYNLSQALKANQTFAKGLEYVQGVALFVYYAISYAVEHVIDTINELSRTKLNIPGNKSIGTFIGELVDKADPLKTVANVIKFAFGVIGAALEAVSPVLGAFGKLAMTALGDIGTALTTLFTGGGFKTLLALVNSSLLATIGLDIALFINNIVGTLSRGMSIVTNIKTLLTTFTNRMKVMNAQIKAGALLDIAKAIGILAASMWLLSTIPTDKLGQVIVTTVALFGALAGMMVLLEKMAGTWKSTAAMFTGGIGFAAIASALLILAGALKVISSIDSDKLTDSMGALLEMIIEMTAATLILGKNSKKIEAGAIAMMSFALAIRILASAIKAIGKMSPDELSTGLQGFTAAVIELTTAMLFLSKAKFDAGQAAGVLALGVAINLLASAMKKIGEMNPDQLSAGIIGMALALTAIGTAMYLMGKYVDMAVSSAASMLIISVALNVLGGAIEKIGSLPMEQWQNGMAGLGASLLGLVVALAAVTKLDTGKMLLGATAMIALSLAIGVVSGALALIGSLPIASIITGLTGVIVTLITFGVAGAIFGSAAHILLIGAGVIAALGVACTVAAVGMGASAIAIGLLASALENLASLGWPEFMSSIGMLVLSFVTLAVTSVTLLPAIAVLIPLAAALMGIAVAANIVAASISVAAIGLTLMATAMKMFEGIDPFAIATALGILLGTLTAFALLAPVLAPLAVELVAIGTAFALIGAGAAAVGAAIFLVSSAMAILAPVVAMADQAMKDFSATFGPAIAEALTAGWNAIVDFGAKAINFIIQMGANIVSGLVTMGAVILQLLVALAGDMLKAIGVPEDWVNAAVNLVMGFIEGIRKKIDDALKTIADFGTKIINKLKEFLQIHSPSEIARKIGNFFGIGFAMGVDDSKSDVVDSVAEMGDAAIDQAQSDALEVKDIWDTLGTFMRTKKSTMASEEVNELRREMIETKNPASDYSKGLADLAEKNDSLAESTGKATKAGKEQKSFFESMKDTIANQLDMFTKFDIKTGITADQMLENMRSNIDGFASWSHRMTVLAERFADHGIEGLYEKLAEMGPKGYETMNAFYTMSEEQLDQVRDLWATGLTLPDTQASIIGDGYNYIGEMMVKGVSSALDDHKALHNSIHGLNEDAKKDFQTEWEIHSPSGVTKKYGEYMLMGIAKGLNDQATRSWLIANIYSLCTMIKKEFTNPETGISAESFKEVGETIMTDFVEGVFVQAGLMSVEGFAKAFLALETVRENITTFCNTVKQLITAAFLIPMGEGGEASYSIVFYNFGLMMREGLSAAFAPESEKVVALMELIKTFCEDIKKKFIEGWEMSGEDGGLQRSEVFYEIGKYAMQGLEEGIREKGADAIAAAEDIMTQIIAIMEKIPKISSPSKVTHRIGAYISEGLEIGIREGAENVYNAAKMVAESSMDGITDNVGRIQDVINTDLDLNPIITPMLDLSYLRQQLNEVDSMFASKRMAVEAQNGGAGSGNATPSTINYTQNNYSPKSLSRYEIYRQTRNQLSQLKGALG